MDFNEARAYVLLARTYYPRCDREGEPVTDTDEHGKEYHVHNCLESRVTVHVEADYGSLAYFLEESRTTQPTQPRKHENIDFPRREGWIVLEEDRWYITRPERRIK